MHNEPCPQTQALTPFSLLVVSPQLSSSPKYLSFGFFFLTRFLYSRIEEHTAQWSGENDSIKAQRFRLTRELEVPARPKGLSLSVALKLFRGTGGMH